jgi:MFS family permease
MTPASPRTTATPAQDNAFDWRTITALNAVSTLAQIGQFGITFVVLPVWLAQQGLDATQLGMFAASLWMGQLPGLAVGPWLCRCWGPTRVIVAGVLCTLVALLCIALVSWPYGMVGGILAGVGMGLRWIGVEPWLYNIAPAHARGRLVGFHETLIALAPVVAPALAGYVGLAGLTVFWIGAGFTLAALVPLAFARVSAVVVSAAPLERHAVSPSVLHNGRAFKQGVLIALMGGMMEAAVSGLFALFAQDRGLAVGQTAQLLAVFGLGGLLMQYGAGWVADHRGVGTAAMCCAVGTALAAVALALPLNYALVMVAMFLLGGFITAFLTLALVASTMTSAGNMARNVSRISMLYSVSSITGPLMAGAAMKATSSNALMWFTAVAALILVVALGWLMAAHSRRAAPNAQRPCQPPPPASPPAEHPAAHRPY